MKTISYKEFQSKEAKLAHTLKRFYEGDQLSHLIDMLDGKCEGFGERVDWRERKIVPRVRNITKSIVDKSGPVMHKPPKFSIWREGMVSPVSNQPFIDLMFACDGFEFFQNADIYSHLLRSVIILQQRYVPDGVVTSNGMYRFDPDRGDGLILTLLDKSNSVVRMNITNTKITELAYITDYVDSTIWFYRVITPTEIIDVKVENDVEYILDVVPNPDGFVPASFVYDVNKPRSGVWIRPPEDLISLQELVNLALTDTEFALAWQKQKTLYFTGDIENTGEIDYSIPTIPNGPTDAYQNSLRFRTDTTKKRITGLGGAVQMTNNPDGSAPMIDFKGPESDLDNLDQVVRDIIKDVAYDWNVNLRFNGSASSGFQLVVEEMDNLTLREKRAQSWIGAFRRFYQITQQLYPEMMEGELIVEFAPPALPVNQKEVEEIWSMKIDAGRATVVDYFMEVHQLSFDEALKKVEEITLLKNTLDGIKVQPNQGESINTNVENNQ